MYPDSVFADPVGSFRYPVPVVDVDPDDPTTLVQLCIASAWLPVMAGSLKQMLLQSTWDTDDPAVIDLVQQRVTNLIMMLADAHDGCGAFVPSILCLEGTFADLDYGWLDDGGGVCPTTWVPGTGWESCYDAPNTRDFLAIKRVFGHSTSIQSYHFHIHTSPTPSTLLAHVNWYQAGVLQRTDTFTLLLSNSLDLDSSTPVDADEVRIDFERDFSAGQVCIMDDWKLCYIGAFPLSQATWSQDLDFTISDWGFVPYGGSTAVYVPGIGWQNSAAQEYIYIHFAGLQTCIGTGFSVDFVVSAMHQAYQGCYISAGSASARDDSLAETPGGTLAITTPVNLSPGDYFNMQINFSLSPLGSCTIAHARASGTGANPFLP